MWKILLLMLANFVWLPVPAGDAAGAGEEFRRIRPDYAQQTVMVEIQGRLVLVFPRAPIGPSIEVIVNGKPYFLDFSNKELLEEAEKLDGKFVEVHGELKDGTVMVTKIKAAASEEDSFRQTVHIEILGKLSKLSKLPNAAYPKRQADQVWMVTAGGRVYELEFATPELLEKARTLKGERVLLGGTLETRLILPRRDPRFPMPIADEPFALEVFRVTSLDLFFDMM